MYNKYKNKIQYFIFNIVKNNERGGNLTSEATIKSMYNGLNEETSFSPYYLIVNSQEKYIEHTPKKQTKYRKTIEKPQYTRYNWYV